MKEKSQMSFPKERFGAFQSDLSKSLHTLLKSNYIMFDMWRRSGAEHMFRSVYVHAFYTHFPEYVDDEIYSKLEFAGKNILYGLNAYVSIHMSYDVDDLLEFVDSFLLDQMNEFLNDYEIPEWCDENYESNQQKKEQEKQQIMGSSISQILL